MEALAASRPVIATRVAAVGELVEHGISGLLVAPGDTEGLIRAIKYLAEHPEVRVRMGTVGREKVQAEFDSRKEARRLLAFFQGEQGIGDIKC